MASSTTVTASGSTWIDTELYGTMWDSPALTYSFPQVVGDVTGYTLGDNQYFSGLTTAQQTVFEATLATWSAVANITFTESETAAAADIRVYWYTHPTDNGSAQVVDFPSATAEGGDIQLGVQMVEGVVGTWNIGDHVYYSITHEVGHALGLKHPHDETNGFPAADANTESLQVGVMSYRAFPGQGVDDPWNIASNSYPSAPMINDIAAIQYLYGANYGTNSGDTVYTFDPTAAVVFKTIWDGGGTDTYDLSAYTGNLFLTLQPGEWSRFGVQYALMDSVLNTNAIGNVCNAYLYQGNTASLIENAIGGSGADYITGNAADNKLTGGAGTDALYGGDGADTLVGGVGADSLIGDAGNDVIYGSAADLDGDIVMGFSAEDGILVTGADLSALAGTSVATTLSLGGGRTMTLSNLSVTADWTASVSGGNTTLSIDGTAPLFASASVNGSTLVLTYTEANTLDATNLPATAAFDVNAGGTAVAVTAAAVDASAKTVTLTLASAVTNGQAVTVSYIDLAGDDTNAIQDRSGNDAATLINQAVTNTTAATSSGDSGSSGTTGTSGVGGPLGEGVTGTFPSNTTGSVTSGSGTPTNASNTLSSSINGSSLSDGDKAAANDALNTFTGSLPSGSNVTVTTMTLTSADGTPGTITLSGSSGTEAMVIDVSQLPKGTVINLANIEFAVIIGAVSVTGGAGSNYVIGDGNGQYIVLGPEDDTLMGGAGADTIGSASGRDSLMGGDDGDVVFGGDDGDYLYGNAGADAVYGNAGTDQLYGGQGADWLFGGQDADTLRGDKGVDVLYGDKGGDFLYGNTGDDWLLGGDGDDVLFGGQGNDWLAGEAGDDWLAGDQGGDTLGGGAGADRFYIARPGLGADLITDFASGTDAIVVSSPNFGSLPAGTLDSRYFALAGSETADTRFVFNSATGALSYDADGSGALAATVIATIGGSSLSARDIQVLAG